MIWFSCEKSVSNLTLKDLLDMKDVIVLCRYAGRFNIFSFCSSSLCQTLSKVLECCCGILFFFETVYNYFRYALDLVTCGVFGLESELMFRDYVKVGFYPL